MHIWLIHQLNVKYAQYSPLLYKNKFEYLQVQPNSLCK